MKLRLIAFKCTDELTEHKSSTNTIRLLSNCFFVSLPSPQLSNAVTSPGVHVAAIPVVSLSVVGGS